MSFCLDALEPRLSIKENGLPSLDFMSHLFNFSARADRILILIQNQCPQPHIQGRFGSRKLQLCSLLLPILLLTSLSIGQEAVAMQ